MFFCFQNFPHGATGIHSLILRCCNISDRGLEAIMEFLQGLYKLEIAGCNEITEQGLWSSPCHGMQAGPETLFREFITASNFHFVKALKGFYDGFHNPITNVTASEDETVTTCGVKNIYNK